MSVQVSSSGIISASGESVGENLYLTDNALSYTPTDYRGYQFRLTELLVANQPYTLQFWDVDVSHTGKTAANLGIDAYWGGGTLRMIYWHGTDYFTDGHADYLVGTFTPTEANVSHANAANLYFNIYNSVSNAEGTRYMSIGKWKLEKGSTPTPWTPSLQDDLYTGDHGFFEVDSGIARIGESYVEGTEFYEL